jgi:hypothetical protein
MPNVIQIHEPLSTVVVPTLGGNDELPKEEQCRIHLVKPSQYQFQRILLKDFSAEAMSEAGDTSFLRAYVAKIENPFQLQLPDGELVDMTIDDLFERDELYPVLTQITFAIRDMNQSGDTDPKNS